MRLVSSNTRRMGRVSPRLSGADRRRIEIEPAAV